MDGVVVHEVVMEMEWLTGEILIIGSGLNENVTCLVLFKRNFSSLVTDL